ncbi:hypothetical protein R3P38DRAFT_2580408 [Favolaschia claudopus]|uniref:Uncharacterized protein n=1 Tax=Favolaschia claudopus TaxID=2862362 RepID=A0AAV9ZD40_9AGAR
MTDCPILVWMLAMNREYSQKEYDACYSVVKTCVEHATIAYEPANPETFRQLMANLLPLLMMRHRRVPRSKWLDKGMQNGKHWIWEATDSRRQTPEGIPPEGFMPSTIGIGYHLAYQRSLCGIAMVQGRQDKVVNIGLGMKFIGVEPNGVPVAAYIASFAHKLTTIERQNIAPELGDEVALRRLCTLLALKAAYINAIGEPLETFDWARLEFDAAGKAVRCDGKPLLGWDFRVWRAALGVAHRYRMIDEHYQCVCAFLRGGETTLVFHETHMELESWVQFIDIDQMIKVLPQLTT